MDLEPFKNKNSSVRKKKKIGFIQARIKLAICNKIKRIGALPRITIYTDFKQAVLNTKDAVRNQTSFSRKLGGYQKRGHSSSNIGQTQTLKKPFLKRNLEGSKLGTLSNRKDSQGQPNTHLAPLQEHSKRLRENFSRGKPNWKNKQGDNRTNNPKKEKPQSWTSPSYNQGKIWKKRLSILLLSQKQYSLQARYISSKHYIIAALKSILYNTIW